MNKWEKIYVSGICIGVGFDKGGITEMVCNSILPDTDRAYKKEKKTVEGYMDLIAQAPTLLTRIDELEKATPTWTTVTADTVWPSEVVACWFTADDHDYIGLYDNDFNKFRSSNNWHHPDIVTRFSIINKPSI